MRIPWLLCNVVDDEDEDEDDVDEDAMWIVNGERDDSAMQENEATEQTLESETAEER